MEYKNYPAFAGVTGPQIESIIDLGKRLEFAAGEHIVSAGDVGTHLHLLLSGSVRVFVANERGVERELAQAGAPCVIGEMELFNGGAHIASVEAAETCATLSLRYDAIRQRLAVDDVGVLKMMFNVASLISERLGDMDKKVLDLLHAHLEQQPKVVNKLRTSFVSAWLAPKRGERLE